MRHSRVEVFYGGYWEKWSAAEFAQTNKNNKQGIGQTHYYPPELSGRAHHGGISSKAAGKGLDCGCGNKKGFNGNEIQAKEFSDGSGLDVYDFNARTYDQQIGRFIQIDPLAEEGGQESLSPFHFSYNNPVSYSDPDGNKEHEAIGYKFEMENGDFKRDKDGNAILTIIKGSDLEKLREQLVQALKKDEKKKVN